MVAVVLGIGLFTSVGSGGKGTASGQPGPGDPVPSFSAHNVGPSGPATVSVSSSSGVHGKPTVLLFFGDWCTACHTELPPLAAAVARQSAGTGPLASVRVVGVDTLDSPSNAAAFIKSAGVTFPVAYDSDGTITAGKFEFTGDPYTVFVRADGTIAKVVPGAQLTPATFADDERAIIPSGS